MKFALVGNPNCGKTSLFNLLTGSNAKVANLPGVTVDPVVAPMRGGDASAGMLELIDLPGAYSLHPKALDEAVTRDALFNPDHEHRPDGIILVLDAANLKRNLYLTLQVLDLGLPTVVVVNETAPTSWSRDALSARLDCPVLAIHALNGRGTEALKEALCSGSLPVQREPLSQQATGWRSRVDIGPLSACLPHLNASGLELLVTADDTPSWLGPEGKQALDEVRNLSLIHI